MSFDMNPADEDPHLDCRREIARLENRIRELEAVQTLVRHAVDASQDRRDHERVLWALIDSNGGELRISEKSLLAYADDCRIEFTEDKPNRCAIYRTNNQDRPTPAPIETAPRPL